jgi:hypothetical protein
MILLLLTERESRGDAQVRFVRNVTSADEESRVSNDVVQLLRKGDNDNALTSCRKHSLEIYGLVFGREGG